MEAYLSICQVLDYCCSVFTYFTCVLWLEWYYLALTCVLQLGCHCAALDRGKVKVKLKLKVFPNKSWRLWQGIWWLAFTFILYLAQFWRQGCQMYASAAIYPNGNYLGFFSVRGWMDPRDSEFEQNWLIWIFSKFFNVPRSRIPPWIVMWIFVLQ